MIGDISRAFGNFALRVTMLLVSKLFYSNLTSFVKSHIIIVSVKMDTFFICF